MAISIFSLVLAGLFQASAVELTNAVKILSVEGTVEIFPASGREWTPARAGQVLEVGYQLRTGPRSRAAVALSNLDIVRVSESTEYELRPPIALGGKPIFELKTGSSYFFGRQKPRALEFRTRVVSGAIRGTEFEMSVAPDGVTRLAMIDGQVELAGANGPVVLNSGDAAEVASGGAVTTSKVLNALNVMQWSLYYPSVLSPAEIELADSDQRELSNSLTAFRDGNVVEALRRYPAGRQPASVQERVYLAGLLLGVGLVGQSEAQLSSVTTADGNAAALAEALSQLIAAVKFQTSDRNATPRLASQFLARSYYEQSRGKLAEALDNARKAAEKSPSWASAHERVAELEFSFGRTGPALAALNQSLSLAPRAAKSLALKGFLLSARNRIAEAVVAFDQAIEADGALGDAWLGRGLCRIRRGDLDGGRADLETAALLEPNRAVVRDYLGKAFADLHDDARADHELALAKKIDAGDPTSPLYLALLRQRQNRINEAIRELEEAEELGGNRKIYRSQLLLDQDSAVRGANLANLYRDAGMNDVSAREATRAVNFDYANYSAHLFLANSYNELRDPRQINVRYETPWLSEYLMANLLSPVGAGTLSQTVSQMEYSKLFERDGLGIASSTEYLSRGDWIQAAAQYGNLGNISYSIDTFYRSETGNRPNNDLEQRTHSAQVKGQLTPDDTVYLQAVLYDATGGDLQQYYDQNSAHRGFRSKETQEPLLLAGYHHAWSPNSHTLFLAGRFDDHYRATDPSQPVLLLAKNPGGTVVAAPVGALPTAALDYESRLELYSAELQHLWTVENHSVIAGARAQTGRFDSRSALGASTPATLGNTTMSNSTQFSTAPFSGSGVTDVDRLGLYGYYFWKIIEPLQLNAGLSYDYLNYPENFRAPPLSNEQNSRDQISPKAGFTWTPRRDSAVRFAYTRSLGGVSFDQSVRLEPTQVAGFNQAFRSLIPESAAGSISGARFETFGLALDQRFPTGTYLGVEADLLNSDASRRIGTVDFFIPPTFVASSTSQELDYEEKTVAVTVNQLLGNEWALGTRYQVSQARLDLTYPEIPSSVSSASHTRNEATLHQLGLFLVYNHSCGFFARAEGIWSSQSNTGYQTDLPGDDFWQANFFAGYRFFDRRAQVQVGVLNVGGSDYNLNPLNLYRELPRERTFVASLQFNF
jgi:Tfp pilus assembly protein PilF